VKVVNVLATVRDRDGAIVKNLSKDDFVIEDNGRRQTIKYFSHESNLPLTIGMLVDTSRSMQAIFDPVRAASGQFFDQVLHNPEDRAFIMHFDWKVAMLQDLTSSREDLVAALEKLKIPKLFSTLLYDAVREGAEKHMKQLNGRKAFIVLSDGMDVRSQSSIATAIEYAQRADTMIYTVLFEHQMGAQRGKRRSRSIQLKGAKTMDRLARETGGGYFKVTDDDPVEKIFARIEDELRNQYSIGYTPDRPAADGNYRKLTLSVKPKNLTVRTREGYYPE
jgi:VWFA-related protein